MAYQPSAAAGTGSKRTMARRERREQLWGNLHPAPPPEASATTASTSSDKKAQSGKLPVKKPVNTVQNHSRHDLGDERKLTIPDDSKRVSSSERQSPNPRPTASIILYNTEEDRPTTVNTGQSFLSHPVTLSEAEFSFLFPS